MLTGAAIFSRRLAVLAVAKSTLPVGTWQHSRLLSTKLEPMFDRVLVKKIEAETQTKGGIMLPENQTKAHNGEVVAVGSGARNREGDFYKPLLKVGDKVMLPEYGGNKVDINGETHWVYREGDIIGRWSP